MFTREDDLREVREFIEVLYEHVRDAFTLGEVEELIRAMAIYMDTGGIRRVMKTIRAEFEREMEFER